MSKFTEGQRIRILESAWDDSDESEDIKARGQLATLDCIYVHTPPLLWGAITDDGRMHLVTEDEIENQEVQP
jgi:hypothetical protein